MAHIDQGLKWHTLKLKDRVTGNILGSGLPSVVALGSTWRFKSRSEILFSTEIDRLSIIGMVDKRSTGLTRGHHCI